MTGGGSDNGSAIVIWDELEQIAFGIMGMTPDQLDEMTPRNYYNKWMGFRMWTKQQQRQEWERTRWLGALGINKWLKEGNRIDPRKLLPLEGDNPVNTLTQSQVDGTVSGYLNWKKQNNVR